nr:MAG TPA: hypothetical protein [Siphoviridae sp. ctMq01]
MLRSKARKTVEITAFFIEWGSRGRWFESSHSDQCKTGKALKLQRFQGFFFSSP